MTVRILDTAFDPWSVLGQYRPASAADGQFGATAVFVGSMRDFNEGDAVASMFLEHYPGMTENYLQKIIDEAMRRWTLTDCLIVHRVGELSPGQPIVLVAVWSAHRKAAFDASRYLMEELKSKAPFWKKEQLENSSRWVEHNTSG
ncbi:MAG: molybdenum cofactor biosynthesis protein MoaE [Thiogranum sp.]|nr:molybdenum cofactor biosynthesis protein MoaE [Thiogranum sp.]